MKATLTKNELIIKGTKGWLRHHCGITSRSIKDANWLVLKPDQYRRNMTVCTNLSDVRSVLAEARAKLGKAHSGNACSDATNSQWFFLADQGNVGVVSINNDGARDGYSGHIQLYVISAENVKNHHSIPKHLQTKFLNSESTK